MLLNYSLACLRIFGEALIPDEITQLLGAAPTTSRMKGDVKYRSKEGRETIAKEGAWLLSADERTPADVDRQAAEILEKLTDDPDKWKSLVQRFDVDFYCGWFMKDSNEDIEIAPQTLAALGARGIKLAVSMYAPTAGDRPTVDPNR